MKSKEEKHENHVKSFQMKTNQPIEIINQSLNHKTKSSLIFKNQERQLYLALELVLTHMNILASGKHDLGINTQ